MRKRITPGSWMSLRPWLSGWFRIPFEHSLMLCVPVWKKDKISCLSVPLGYRMWTKQKSKLELAADMIRQDMGNSSPSKQILFFLMKRWTVILSPSALLSQICLAAGRYWHMSLPRNREVKKRNFFSVRFFRSSCRFSLPGRRRHPWTVPAVHGWNIFRCFCTRSGGT